MPANRDRRRRRTAAQGWEQAKAAKAIVWAHIHWSERTDLGRRLELLKGKFRGVTAKAALGLVRLQGRFYGAVIADGKKIARISGISESGWWHWARPELEHYQFIRTVERGGGRLKGGDGHANVYMSPDGGHEAAPPTPPAVPAPAPPTPREAAAETDDAVARRARIRQEAALAHERSRAGPAP